MVHGDYLDVISTVVKDIIELKWESDNVPKEWDEDVLMEMFNWYSWAVPAGLVEVVYKYGELQGFMDWIRLHEVPKSRKRDEFNFSPDYKEGSILYISNCCIRDDGVRHGTMWRLMYKVRNKNDGFEYVCWHNKNKLKIYENTKKYEMMGAPVELHKM